MSSSFLNIPGYTWQAPVQTLAELPNSGQTGDVRLVIDIGAAYWWDGSTWQALTAGGGATNSFVIIQTNTGTYPVATSPTDTLTLTSADPSSYSFGGNSATDTVTLTIQTASGSQKGLLSSADWTTFNSKQAAGNYITALTGDVTASGPGSVAATIAANAVTNAKLATIPGNTIKGTNVGGVGQTVIDLTVAQVKGMLSLAGTNSGDVTVGVVGGTPNANGMSISGQAITLQPANNTFPGVLTSVDWNIFNNKVGTTRTISTSSPLTGGGDLSANRTISFSNQTANTVLAGPTTGSAAAPTFRALVAGDFPSGVFATTTLNNIGSVAIPNGADLIPANAFGYSIGSFAKPVNKIYADGFYGSTDVKNLDIFSGIISDNSNVASIAFLSRQLKNFAGVPTLDWNNEALYDVSTNNISLNWNSRVLYDANAIPVLDWSTRQLFWDSGGELGNLASFSDGNFTLWNDGVNPQGNLILKDSTSTVDVSTGVFGNIIVAHTSNGGVVSSTAGNSLVLGRATGINSTLRNNGGAGTITFGNASGENASIRTNSDSSMTFGQANALNNSIYSDGNGCLTFGNIGVDLGTIHASSNGSMAFGAVDGSGAAENGIYTNADGAFAFGRIDGGNSVYINASGNGALAFGRAADGDGTIIEATNQGSFAGGNASSGAFISSSGSGSMSHGHVDSSTGGIRADADGAHAFGYSENGYIYASNSGAFAIGRMSGGELRASGEGCLAFCSSDAGPTSYVETSGEASSAFIKLDGDGSTAISGGNGTYIAGQVDTGGTIQATNDGAISTGVARDTGEIKSQGTASTAAGFANGFDILPSSIVASGDGSFVRGSANGGGQINAGGAGSVLFGAADSNGTLLNNGDASFVAGKVENGGSINNTGVGAVLFGSTYGVGSIVHSSADGSFTTGRAYGGGEIFTESGGDGSDAHGISGGSGSKIHTGGAGATARGSAQNGNVIDSLGVGAFCSGSDILGDITAVGEASHLFGTNLDDGMFAYSMMLGHGMVADETGFYAGYGSVNLKINSNYSYFKKSIRLSSIVDTGTTLTLDQTKVLWVFSGSSATTWTLPALSSTVDIYYKIKNRGSANITLQRAGADQLYDNSAVNSIIIPAGQSREINNDGTYWLVS